MLDKLLWRCPICKTNDSIAHRRRLLGADPVHCEHCGSAWKLHRVVGGLDFRLQAVAGPMQGEDRPLAEWYDMMKADFVPHALADPQLGLEEGEVLYLRGQPESLFVSQIDPRFRPVLKANEPTEPGESPAFLDLGSVDLFLTDNRLVVQVGGQRVDLALDTVRSVVLLIDRYLIIRHEKRQVEVFEFRQESSLKWRAYLDHALRPIAEAHGFRLHIAYD